MKSKNMSNLQQGNMWSAITWLAYGQHAWILVTAAGVSCIVYYSLAILEKFEGKP